MELFVYNRLYENRQEIFIKNAPFLALQNHEKRE